VGDWYLSADQTKLAYSRYLYKFHVKSVNGVKPAKLYWYELFVSDDGSGNITSTLRTWDVPEDQDDFDTPVWAIAPAIRAQNGHYLIMPIEITFEAVETNEPITDNKNPVTGDWMLGHGQRVFPDRKTKDDSTPRNRVYVVVKTGMPNLTVRLKAFDVDDPSNDPEIDPNDEPVPGRGEDNGGNIGNLPPPTAFFPGLAEVECVTDSLGIAKRNGNFPQLVVSMQPGDNFRVAVEIMNDRGLSRLQVTDPNAAGYIAGDSAQQPPGFVGVVSPMLTVWRKLHIEVDTMTKWEGEKPGPDRVMVVGKEWSEGPLLHTTRAKAYRKALSFNGLEIRGRHDKVWECAIGRP
jgi:hypothetical protein